VLASKLSPFRAINNESFSIFLVSVETLLHFKNELCNEAIVIMCDILNSDEDKKKPFRLKGLFKVF
jgi:hypothetical protein